MACNKLERRMSDTFIIQSHHTPPRTRQPINIVHEDDEDDNVFNDSTEEEHADDVSIRAMTSSRNKMESAMRQFSHIFGKLEERMRSKDATDIERAFIKKQVRHLVDGAKQVDFMMTDLNERTKRMEKFLENRQKGLDWNYWQN
jgi:hypothetical protein